MVASMAACDETGDLSRMWTHNHPLWPKRFSNTLARGLQNVTFKATLRASQKEHGENEFFHSSPGGISGMRQCVLIRASDWGLFWQVWECSQRRIYTDGHLLGTVHAGRCQVGPGEKSQECKIKGISWNILTCKTRPSEWPDAIKATGIYIFCISPI